MMGVWPFYSSYRSSPELLQFLHPASSRSCRRFSWCPIVEAAVGSGDSPLGSWFLLFCSRSCSPGFSRV
jgi:hypothetical protein